MPRNFAAEVRKERETLAAEIIREIRRQVPEFGRPLSGQFGAGIQYGVETALAEFADLIDGRGGPPRGAVGAVGTAGAAPGDRYRDRGLGEERLRVYRALGRGELAEGRSLDALQAAYRLGARVAWRRYARVARRVGLGPDLVVLLAEAIFAHIDEITSASVQGYAEAKADHAGAQGRLRVRLLHLLVTAADPVEVEQAAAAADWPLPERIACVSLGPPPAPAPGPAPPAGRRRRLPDPVLADLDCPDPYLLVPEPALLLRDGQVRAVLQGREAVIGPTVPVGLAADSLRWARTVRAAALRPGPPVPADAAPAEPFNCDDCLPDLLLLGDEPLVRLMAERRLRPLAALTAKQSERLAATLLAWLQTDSGSAPEVAVRLGIHPQTARQRLHRVHQLFGADLHDPDARFEFEVALRGRLLQEKLISRHPYCTGS
ncbi:helix-turn-helix domain-containing protein [Streptacidiphilus sp. PB12-B1b]|uniref:helix-turn-helix domain-containing protein n=1 Tax=Streptacidiphilus sp. PB12-B1b TaxID=2705012 RepID=UPI001CDBCE91|nr:helix-turn-helix domain-containing protein [Streptacidiphilus sp. PB12-B1b]